jgi:hypothetical protein
MKDEKKKLTSREITVRVILVLISVGITLLALNLILGRTSRYAVNSSMSLNDSINLRNKTFALKNRHGFTDVNHDYQKPDSIFRIAVLGDSFIWGDGLPYEQVWSHKLERKLKKAYKNIEVLHWGINGWQTTDEMKFYTEEGYKYKPDLLIIGYVDNDPDMGYFKQLNPAWRDRLGILYKLLPSLTDKLWNNVYSNSYSKWLNRLYEKENLERYQVLLDSFNTRLNTDSMKQFYILTPSCLADGCYDKYQIIKPHLQKAGFKYLEVNEACRKQLTDCSDLEIRANPMNYHPGTYMTDVFANEVFTYITERRLVPDTLQRPLAPGP